jgi:hypothetical protein
MDAKQLSYLIAEKEDFETRFALVLTFKLVVPRVFRREDMASGDEEELVAIDAISHEEATGARSKRRWPGQR